MKKVMPIFPILTLIFITLKLAEVGQVATWSWWWVFAPLWIPFIIVCVAILLKTFVPEQNKISKSNNK